MVNFTKWFIKIDLFPITPLFYINGNEGFKSITGSIITILTGLCFCFILFIKLNEYINTDNPIQLEKTEKIQNYTAIIDSNDLLLAYSLELEQSNNLNKSFYSKLNIDFFASNNNNQNNQNILLFDNCTKINLNAFQISNENKNYLIRSAKCLITNLTLNTEENFLLSNLILSLVNNNYNNTENNEYKDISIIFNLYFQSLFDSPSKFKKPVIQKDIDIFSQKIYLNNFYEYSAKIKTVKSLIKSDIFHKKINENKYFYIDNIYKVDSHINNNKTIFQLKLLLDNHITKKIYIYPNFLQIFSFLGGVLYLLSLFFTLILGWLRGYEQSQYITSKCFNRDSTLPKNETPNNLSKLLKEIVSHQNEATDNISNIGPDGVNNQSQNNISKNNISKQYLNKKDNNLFSNGLKLNNYTSGKFDSTQKRRKTFSRISLTTMKRRQSQAELQFILFNKVKSPYLILFQMYLGIENIIKWNEEWLTYKNAILSTKMQVIMKYVDLFKLYTLEEGIGPFKRSLDEFTNCWNYLKNNEKRPEIKEFLKGLKEIVDPITD